MSQSKAIAVSVITPVYKTPLNYFKECLNSLHNQTVPNAEFIIVFDGEDKLLCEFCEEYKKKDTRFKLYIQPHYGVSTTRNFGISQATGEYITFVDADDEIKPECCQAAYEYAKKNDSDIVLFDYIPAAKQNEEKNYASSSIPELSSQEKEELQKQSFALKDMRYVSAVSTWGKLIKKKLTQEYSIHFSPDVKIAVDRPFSFACFFYANKISYLHKKTYIYNKVENSITYQFYSDKCPLLLKYLLEIKKIAPKYSREIGAQAIAIFYSTWQSCYFNSNNDDTLHQRIIKISNIIKSQDFQHLIANVNTDELIPIIKLELFLMRKKITFHVWLHALKWYFFSKSEFLRF